jgi:flagellar basal body-associated protein FliL
MKSFKLSLMALAVMVTMGISNHVMAAEEKAEEGVPALHFVELNPLIIPVINEHGVTKMVSLVVAVEVDSQEKADKVTKYSPRLTDAYLSDLYGAFSHYDPNKGVLPIAYLKKRLNKMSAKVLGDDVVADVLLQVLQSRST